MSREIIIQCGRKSTARVSKRPLNKSTACLRAVLLRWGQFGLSVVTEAVDEPTLGLCEKYADVIQIGARNMRNFSPLKRAGRARKPVLLKRGMSAALEEFLLAAEYITAEENYQVILCERGVRTFCNHVRRFRSSR